MIISERGARLGREQIRRIQKTIKENCPNATFLVDGLECSNLFDPTVLARASNVREIKILSTVPAFEFFLSENVVRIEFDEYSPLSYGLGLLVSRRIESALPMFSRILKSYETSISDTTFTFTSLGVCAGAFIYNRFSITPITYLYPIGIVVAFGFLSKISRIVLTNSFSLVLEQPTGKSSPWTIPIATAIFGCILTAALTWYLKL